MSKQALEAVIGRAVTDSVFRDALFARPEATLVDFDLTTDEVTALRAIDFETMDAFAGILDERMSTFAALERPSVPTDPPICRD